MGRIYEHGVHPKSELIRWAANSFQIKSTVAVAQLFDISCHVQSPVFDNGQGVAFAWWQAALGKMTMKATSLGCLSHERPTYPLTALTVCLSLVYGDPVPKNEVSSPCLPILNNLKAPLAKVRKYSLGGYLITRTPRLMGALGFTLVLIQILFLPQIFTTASVQSQMSRPGNHPTTSDCVARCF